MRWLVWLGVAVIGCSPASLNIAALSTLPVGDCSAEFKAGARTPDHPHSLYEGWAAALCLWADLGEPKAGGFPLFEVELEE